MPSYIYVAFLRVYDLHQVFALQLLLVRVHIAARAALRSREHNYRWILIVSSMTLQFYGAHLAVDHASSDATGSLAKEQA